MPATRRSFAILTFVGMVMAMLGCGATKAAAPPTCPSPFATPNPAPATPPAPEAGEAKDSVPLCQDAKAKPPHGLCCDVGPGPECVRRLNFARRVTASTVALTIIRYRQKEGGQTRYATGFVINERGYVITSRHFTYGSHAILAEPRELNQARVLVPHREVPMAVLAEDEITDSALLIPLTDDSLPPPLAIDVTPLKIGDRVWQFGRTTVWAFGDVLDTEYYDGANAGLLHTSVHVEGGDSGGPLVNAFGHVRGITTSQGDFFGNFVPIGLALYALGYELP